MHHVVAILVEVNTTTNLSFLISDFAVGAFESNRVVLLRSRSVVDLEAQLEINPTLLDLKSHPSCMYRGQPMHCFKATICLKYTGQNLPPFLG